MRNFDISREDMPRARRVDPAHETLVVGAGGPEAGPLHAAQLVGAVAAEPLVPGSLRGAPREERRRDVGAARHRRGGPRRRSNARADENAHAHVPLSTLREVLASPAPSRHRCAVRVVGHFPKDVHDFCVPNDDDDSTWSYNLSLVLEDGTARLKAHLAPPESASFSTASRRATCGRRRRRTTASPPRRARSRSTTSTDRTRDGSWCAS